MIKELYLPEISIPRRLRAIKNFIALGLLASVSVSWRLWISDRDFPLVPVFDGLTPLPVPADKILFGLFLFCTVMLLFARRPRFSIAIVLLIGAYLAIADQNRLQPWFYQYMLMLLVLAFYNWRVDEPKDHTAIFTTLKIIVAAIYFWSGIQKLNPNFMADTWPWLIKPLESIFTPEGCTVILKSGYGIPFIEIFIGIALFSASAKRIAIPLAIGMHLLILILMGPFGHNYNPVIWGWNLGMVFMIYFLFAGTADSKYHSVSYLFSFKPAYIILLLCGLMPGLNLVNKWDSYLSASLYSGNTSNGIIYLSDNARSRLPYYLQSFTKPEGNKQNSLNIKQWAMHELQVPGYPEKRIFEAVEKYIGRITCCDDEVSLFYKDKWNILADN
ncbi:MAG: HTTM domain-containing protein [Bacteroidia bacterium]